MPCTTAIAIAAIPTAPPRVRRPWPKPLATLLLLWEAFQDAREMRNAMAFPFDDE